MSKKVRDLRRRLEAMTRAGSPDVSDETFRQFLQILADLDDMDIEAFFKRLTGRATRPPPLKGSFDEKAVVAKLRKALNDDNAFHDEIVALGKLRAATKPALTRVFYVLFDRTRGVPSKATRADLLRLIEDERNILVRNEKMGQMLGRRIVPAE